MQRPSQPSASARTSGAMTTSPVRHLLAQTPRFGSVIVLVLLIIYFGVATRGNMLSLGSITSILNQISVLGVLSLGLTVCLIIGQFDLSIGWNASLSGMVATGLMSVNSVPTPLAILAAIGVGVLVGLVNGLVVTFLRVNALLATLAMGSVLGGLISWYSVSPFLNLPADFTALGQTVIFHIPSPAIVMAVLGVLLWVFLQQTPPGRWMYAIGGNEEAARVAGVRIRPIQILGFIVCGVCASVSGILLAAQLGSGQPTGAVGLLLSAFAAAFLGSATWREGEFHIAGTVVGVLVLGVVFSGLALTNAPYFLKDIATGLILILAVGSSSLLRTRRKKL